jgi:protein-S-isoprenylcysteine O-methyltransferase Ste14
VRTLVLAFGVLFFAAIGWAVRFHFVSGKKKPIGFLLLTLLSIGNVVVFAREVWLRRQDETRLWVVLALFGVASGLFAWAVIASRRAELKLLFDRAAPHSLVQEGPYRFIRHPFYASYVVYWAGVGLATLHPANLAGFAILLLAFIAGARAEERRFETSPLAADYAAYKRRAGLFWPRLWPAG